MKYKSDVRTFQSLFGPGVRKASYIPTSKTQVLGVLPAPGGVLNFGFDQYIKGSFAS